MACLCDLEVDVATLAEGASVEAFRKRCFDAYEEKLNNDTVRAIKVVPVKVRLSQDLKGELQGFAMSGLTQATIDSLSDDGFVVAMNLGLAGRLLTLVDNPLGFNEVMLALRSNPISLGQTDKTNKMWWSAIRRLQRVDPDLFQLYDQLIPHTKLFTAVYPQVASLTVEQVPRLLAGRVE